MNSPNLHDPRVSTGTYENAKTTTIDAIKAPESTKGWRNWEPRHNVRAPRGRFSAKFLSPRVLEKGHHFDHDLPMETNM